MYQKSSALNRLPLWAFLGIISVLFPLQSIAQGDAATGKTQSAVCSTCHGPEGISSNESWPNIAGQKYGYLVKQITAFRDGTRDDPSMKMMTSSLKDEDIQNLAAYFSSFKLSVSAGELVAATQSASKGSSPEAGKKLYSQNCVFCHQADAIGKPGLAPSLTNKELLTYASDNFFSGTIRDGRPGTGMPPFAHLGEDNINSIVAYLRSHAEQPGESSTIDALPAAEGDQQLGKELFDMICSTCHGDSGDGYASGGTGTAIGTKGFLSKASDGFIRTTIQKGRSNTRMLGFSGPTGLANLDDHEIDSIIVFLRSLPQTN